MFWGGSKSESTTQMQMEQPNRNHRCLGNRCRNFMPSPISTHIRAVLGFAGNPCCIPFVLYSTMFSLPEIIMLCCVKWEGGVCKWWRELYGECCVCYTTIYLASAPKEHIRSASLPRTVCAEYAQNRCRQGFCFRVFLFCFVSLPALHD